MKIYKLLPLVLLVLVFLPNSDAICCDSGCSPTSNVCCTPEGGGPSVGYVGCWDATTNQYVCPTTSIGECLECGANSCETTVECSWDSVASGTCNACEVTYDNDNFPIDSQCSTACGPGETKCLDGSCQVNCDEPGTEPPNCNPSNGDDGICCVDPLNNPDGICDSNCLSTQDLDCGGIIPTPTHGECSNNQCVEISGIGQDLCTTNANCADVPTDPNHKTCGASGSCLTVSGVGTDTCTNDAQCNPPPGTFPFHAECNNQEQCVQVSGVGTDLCTTNTNCIGVPSTPSHKACGASGSCLTISGAGTDTCTNDAQCLQLPPPGENPAYNMCSVSLQCIPISGLGQDLCSITGDCAGQPTSPNHKTCSASGNCVSVIGEGTDTCSTNSQCTITPLPPPGGVTCTAASGDCCLPSRDGTCDNDCVEGVDPECQNGLPQDDGLCNADNDLICDINCFEGIDIPDCNDFAYTEAPNDGCSPIIDGTCDLDCPLNTDLDCSFIPGLSQCDNNGVCEDFEGCHCNDCIDNPTNACISGLFCCGNVCSGDNDNDLICDALDYCKNTFTENDNPDNQLDTDGDCYIDNTKTTLFGFCGDECDQIGSCFDVFGSRQCCDDLAGSTGRGAFHGFTDDCPNIGIESIGCWDSCSEIDSEGNIITYEIGQCIEGSRAVTQLVNGIPSITTTEPCTSIPLISFYTNLSILSTFLILIGYYLRRK